MARKPKMLVYEKGYRVLREPYAGVFMCDNDRGNNILRDLEPPAHDKWDYARSPVGMVALRELDMFIKQSLKTMADSQTSEPEDIPGLDRYLPDNEERDYLPSENGEALEETGLSSGEESSREIGADKEDFAETGIVARKGIVTSKHQDKIILTPPEGGSGTVGRGAGFEKGEKEGMRIKTSLINFRSFVQNKKGIVEYHLAITGRENCEGAINLVAVGDDGIYAVSIESVSDLKSGKQVDFAQSLIKDLIIKTGETVKLAVRLSSDSKYALGIETYEG